MKTVAQPWAEIEPPVVSGTVRANYAIGIDPHVALLHEMTARIAMDAPLPNVLSDAVACVTSVVKCDSCFIYVLEQDQLVLRASKNPHPESLNRLKLKLGSGITGWVAEHRQPVAIASRAFQDRRFLTFNELPEDRFEAFLSVPVLSRGKVVGVINLQNRTPLAYSEREIKLVAMIGFLIGAQLERARLEEENQSLSNRLETRKSLERAKGILQRDLKINEEDAYLMLQRQSQQRRKPMKEIAEAIILSQLVKSASL
jgi:uroporphyrinogen-III synthase